MESEKREPSLLYVYSRNIEVRLALLGISHSEMAAKLNVSPTNITRIKNHIVKFIDPETLSELLRFFNCTPNDLLLKQEGVNYDFTW